ncbi:hypothetical protein [Actinokineospora fastidiosa]|uniref:Uncharacterized protein n=1 Tax=Actinokineospora fastidiosa TaxID=1816 RepID=A0A918GQS6_9PSEU|nr:hypothetical protein [Actinokineospora fastidiosa]GGS54417.1 hypothetical protein GCM10010171_56940 [Actinokineospora fastidiosa]
MPPSEVPNFPTIAGFYSQLAGVLAGFAFAGLIALIAAQLTRDSVASRTLYGYLPLIAAFAGLIATSLNYAIIAGEAPATNRLTILEIVAGVGFAMAFLMLLHAILLLLGGLRKDSPRQGQVLARTVNVLRIYLLYGVCPIVGLLIYGAIKDFITIKYGTGTTLRGLDYAVFVLIAVYVGWTIVIRRAFAPREIALGRSATVLSVCAIAIALLTLAASTVVLSFTSRLTAYPDVWPLLSFGVYIAFAMTFAYSIGRMNTHSAAAEISVDAQDLPLVDLPEPVEASPDSSVHDDDLQDRAL